MFHRRSQGWLLRVVNIRWRTHANERWPDLLVTVFHRRTRMTPHLFLGHANWTPFHRTPSSAATMTTTMTTANASASLADRASLYSSCVQLHLLILTNNVAQCSPVFQRWQQLEPFRCIVSLGVCPLPFSVSCNCMHVYPVSYSVFHAACRAGKWVWKKLVLRVFTT